jgi:hypothetical protein
MAKALPDGLVPNSDMRELLVAKKLEGLFNKWYDDRPERSGIHASSVVQTDTQFCLRQLVLEAFFPHTPLRLFDKTKRIFLHGEVIHRKWQALFQAAGIAEVIEKTFYDKATGLLFTPDVIARMLGTRVIVEIKSMSHKSFTETNTPHALARRQSNVYMHYSGVKLSLIIAEDKDNQDYKFWLLEYDPEAVQKYVRRLQRIVKFREIFKSSGKLPRRHTLCVDMSSPKARNCPVAQFCFSKTKREKLADAETE